MKYVQDTMYDNSWQAVAPAIVGNAFVWDDTMSGDGENTVCKKVNLSKGDLIDWLDKNDQTWVRCAVVACPGDKLPPKVLIDGDSWPAGQGVYALRKEKKGKPCLKAWTSNFEEYCSWYSVEHVCDSNRLVPLVEKPVPKMCKRSRRVTHSHVG